MLKIHLKNLQFFAYHGIYEEERVLGNEFVVNIEVSYTPATLPVLHIKDTINYVDVYQLTAKYMAVPTPLLETLASIIAEAILAQFSLAETVYISIDKMKPPVEKFRGHLGVSLQIKRA